MKVAHFGAVDVTTIINCKIIPENQKIVLNMMGHKQRLFGSKFYNFKSLEV